MIDTLVIAGMLNVAIITGLTLAGIGVSLVMESRTGIILSIAIGGALLF